MGGSFRPSWVETTQLAGRGNSGARRRVSGVESRLRRESVRAFSQSAMARVFLVLLTAVLPVTLCGTVEISEARLAPAGFVPPRTERTDLGARCIARRQPAGCASVRRFRERCQPRGRRTHRHGMVGAGRTAGVDLGRLVREAGSPGGHTGRLGRCADERYTDGVSVGGARTWVGRRDVRTRTRRRRRLDAPRRGGPECPGKRDIVRTADTAIVVRGRRCMRAAARRDGDQRRGTRAS